MLLLPHGQPLSLEDLLGFLRNSSMRHVSFGYRHMANTEDNQFLLELYLRAECHFLLGYLWQFDTSVVSSIDQWRW